MEFLRIWNVSEVFFSRGKSMSELQQGDILDESYLGE